LPEKKHNKDSEKAEIDKQIRSALKSWKPSTPAAAAAAAVASSLPTTLLRP
jgi:hypothetical protein